jgi:hypothetical protein
MAKVSLTAVVCVLSLALLGKTVAGRFVNGGNDGMCFIRTKPTLTGYF